MEENDDTISERNELDSQLFLPKEYSNSKKKVCQIIRKLFQIEKKESIKDHFDSFTNLESIEEEVFGTIKDEEEKYAFFPVRLYISQILKNEGAYIHLSVQISDSILHWFDSSMVFIKSWKGSNVTALCYPQNKEGEEVGMVQNSKKNRLKVCKIIEKWNCEKEYDDHLNNCQSFVVSIFDSFGFHSNFTEYSGMVGDFMRHVSKKTIQINPSLLKQHKILIEWKTHQELDDWNNLNKHTFPDALQLLKAFHRAFQLKGEEGKNCPFPHPTLLYPSSSLY